MHLQELDTEAAQAWFDRLPPGLRLRSLSPDFARADTARTEGLTCVHIGVTDGSRHWLYSTHLRAWANGDGLAAIAPYGYGGPVADTEDPGFLEEAAALHCQWAASRRVVGEFCRFHPEADHARFFHGEVQHNRTTVSVDLLQPGRVGRYNALARRKIRKAGGADVRWSTGAMDWRRFADFYRSAMRAMGAHERYHFRDVYFAALRELCGVELCILSDEQEEWLSAGVYLFSRHMAPNLGTVEYHLGASSAAGHAAGAAYRLQDEAALEGRRRGMAHLYLGGGTTPDPSNPLLFYKRAFSRRERPFQVGLAIHDTARWARLAQARGYDPRSAPASLLFE